MSQAASPMKIEVDRLTLTNLGGGRLEEQFQHCISEAMMIHEDREEYAKKGGDKIEYSITMKVILQIDKEGSAELVMACDGKGPRLRSKSQRANIMGGKMMVNTKPANEQIPLPREAKLAEVN